MSRSITTIALFLLAFALCSTKSPAAEAWDHWQTYDDGSTKRINHSVWEAILLNYVRPGADGIHRVAYSRVRPDDLRALDGYLDTMSEIAITDYRRSEQMAFWINVYNALTIDLILAHYPVPSIRKLHHRRSARQIGPWDQMLITIEGMALSLNDIEERILKPIWQDPRILYALSCGAIGCPNLQPVPYSSKTLEKQLSDVAMAYINDKRCIMIAGGKLRVSSLYRWNIRDFGGSDQGIIHHLMAYAEPALAMSLQKFDQIHGDNFDWRLNDIED